MSLKKSQEENERKIERKTEMHLSFNSGDEARLAKMTGVGVFN